jgi:hypothetical protein
MNKEKVIKYLQEAKEILTKEFPHGDTYGEYILGSIEIAKMIQIEELHSERDIVTNEE